VNEYESDVILSVINKLYEKDVEEKVFAEDGEPRIGVICMYSEQVRLIVKKINTLSWARSLLEKQILKVDTVDGYQGKENDFVILSLVRSNQKGIQGHVSSEERANVSLSRAKEGLFIVGNKDMWNSKNQDTAFGKVFDFINTKISTQIENELTSSNDYQILSSNVLE
jgi:superfamily I DNA and/or RNA helicase